MTFEEFKTLYKREANKTHMYTYKTRPTQYTVGITTIVIKGLPLKTDEELEIEFARLHQHTSTDDC